MFRLHYNKALDMFTVRRADRSIVCASERGADLPRVGTTATLAPRMHLIITTTQLLAAKDGKRPVLNVVETRFPFARLLIARLKEVF